MFAFPIPKRHPLNTMAPDPVAQEYYYRKWKRMKKIIKDTMFVSTWILYKLFVLILFFNSLVIKYILM